MRLLDQALLNPVLISESLSNTMELHLACILVHALLDFLKGMQAFQTINFDNQPLM